MCHYLSHASTEPLLYANTEVLVLLQELYYSHKAILDQWGTMHHTHVSQYTPSEINSMSQSGLKDVCDQHFIQPGILCIPNTL